MSRQAVIKKSVCFGCHSHCKVDVHVEDGSLVKVEPDSTSPRYQSQHIITASCAIAQAAAEWYYHPGRLSFPLKRAGEKGEGKWQQISWEQALDEIAEKLEGMKEKYGAEAIGTTSGTGRTHDEFRIRFFNLLGSPNNVGQGTI